jgi:hypothetical protein
MPLVCSYCNTINPDANTACLACGAPLENLGTPPRLEVVSAGQFATQPASTSTFSMQEFKQIGDSSEQLYLSALTTYSTIWRTMGEAISISVTAFILGLTGAATGHPLGAVLGALAVGFAVGITTKRYWLAALSAPLGALFGAVLWMVPWALGVGLGGMVYTIAFFAGLAALVGGRPGLERRNWWARARPWLGMGGSLLFVILGLLLGYSMRWLLNSLFTSETLQHFVWMLSEGWSI